MSEARDEELLRRVREGDQEAFRGLFGRYASGAKALALRVVRQRHLADEIVQEAFLAVWRNPEAFDEDRGSFRAWLMGLVHHRAVDLVRREEAHRRRAESAIAGVREEIVDPAEEIVQQAGMPAQREAVRSALADLPPEQREVLELMYFSGLSQTQIADRTGLALGTVKSRTLLGMRRMRTSLQELER